MLRCYIGGARREELAEQEEDAIAAMVKQDLLHIMGIDQEPVLLKVFQNRKSNVQYQVGHAGMIASIDKEVSAVPGLFLTGSAYTGIGIPDCIANGTRTAESMLHYLTDKSETVV